VTRCTSYFRFYQRSNKFEYLLLRVLRHDLQLLNNLINDRNSHIALLSTILSPLIQIVVEEQSSVLAWDYGGCLHRTIYLHNELLWLTTILVFSASNINFRRNARLQVPPIAEAPLRLLVVACKPMLGAEDRRPPMLPAPSSVGEEPERPKTQEGQGRRFRHRHRRRYKFIDRVEGFGAD
jgi:hypothetical protein